MTLGQPREIGIVSDSLPIREAPVLSVESLNRLIKGQLENQFASVWVKGEVSNFKAHTSGHWYFSLKDQKAQVRAVMFKSVNRNVRFKVQDGTEVIIKGRVTVFEPRGEYQITCESMEAVGAGALQRAFLELKEKLKNEGLFESKRKRAIPKNPRHIAIVTSPTGAAIQDILNILNRRSRGLEITIVPTLVQGAQAAPLIIKALELAYRLKGLDAIIIGRGGGSIEDMWCFNDEALARKIIQSPVPVISAVGHEIDFTICDFVADLRAPTPSAAAELVAESSEELVAKFKNLNRLLLVSWEKYFNHCKKTWELVKKSLVDPVKKLEELSQKNDMLFDRLRELIFYFFETRENKVKLLRQGLVHPSHILEKKFLSLTNQIARLADGENKILIAKKNKLERLMAVLDSLSPLRVVDRGFSLVTYNGVLVKEAAKLKVGDVIEIQFAAGKAISQIKEIT